MKKISFISFIVVVIFIMFLMSCGSSNSKSGKIKLEIFYTVYDGETNELKNKYKKLPKDLGDVSKTDYYDKNSSVDLYAFAYDGYIFTGWYFEDTLLSSNNNLNQMVWDKDVLIEARFKLDKYTLKLWSNNPSLGQVMIKDINQDWQDDCQDKFLYTKSVTIAAQSKSYIRFLGWYDEDNNIVSNNQVFTFNMPNSNYILEAKWNNFNITYDLDGGTNNPNNLLNYFVDSGIIKLHEPTKGNYYFSGWEYNGKIVTEINSTELCHINLKAIWKSYTLTTEINDPNAGYRTYYNQRQIKPGTMVTLNATANSGYYFEGWYNGDILISNETKTNIVMPAENVIYTAVFKPNSNIPYKVYHYQENANDDNFTLYEQEQLYGETNSMTNVKNKNYPGFESSGIITQKNINYDGSTKINIYYYRKNYILTLESEINKQFISCEGLNFINNTGSYKYGEKITIKINDNLYDEFDGWYDEKGNLITTDKNYVFNMPEYKLKYVAKWTISGKTPYRVEHYKQNVEDDNYPSVPYETDNLIGTTDTQTNGLVKTYDGFTQPTILQRKIYGDGSTVIKLYYTRNSYSVELNNNDKAGTITGAGTYKHGKEITIEATTNSGYTFVGWYKDNKEYTTDKSFNYEIGSSNVIFEARYTANKYTITIDNQAEGVSISGIISGNEYEYDSQISLKATNIPSGYNIKWIRDDDVVSFGEYYTFSVPVGNLTIIIRNILFFGKYPQTRVTDDTLINNLNKMAGYKPNSTNKYNWTDYNYYISTSITSFMFYQDIDYDNNGTYDFRGVYFTQYRPMYSSKSSSESNQEENGYLPNTIYWFRYDPIEWNILSEINGKVLIIANLILDSQDYYPSSSTSSFNHNGGKGYANNYELSNIRKFLNENFYNTAFNKQEKSIIQTTLVDNSASSTTSNGSDYACNNTNDKLFLLSYKEATTYYTSKLERMAKGSDYAKSQGLGVSKNSSFLGSSSWRLRSPSKVYDGISKVFALNVIPTGGFAEQECDETSKGIRPVCWISL